MEEETYADVIDSWNMSEEKRQGKTLTEYIKDNNIKIKEIDMSPLGDLKKISKKANGGLMRSMYARGSEPVEEMQESGIMQLSEMPSGDFMLKDEYDKYRFEMLEQGLEPMSLEQFRQQAMSEGEMAAGSIDPTIRIEEVVKEFIREKGRKPRSLEELKEFYEIRIGTARSPEMDTVRELVEEDKTRITLAGGSFPDLSGDGKITQKDILIGKGVIDRDDKQSGGLAAILGV